MHGIVRGRSRIRFGRALLIVVALRAAALLLPAGCSDDLPRYVWEGLLQHAGHNPYLVAPRNPVVFFVTEMPLVRTSAGMRPSA